MIDRERFEAHDDWYLKYEEKVMDAVIKFAADPARVNRYKVFTEHGLMQAFEADVNNDLMLVNFAVMTVAAYSVIFLGSCSPIHIRACLGCCGIATIMLSFIVGCSVMYLAGQLGSDINTLLPFMLVGIGVDDMFVISNAID